MKSLVNNAWQSTGVYRRGHFTRVLSVNIRRWALLSPRQIDRFEGFILGGTFSIECVFPNATNHLHFYGVVDESGFPLKVPHGFSLVGRRAGGAYDRSILSIIMSSISGIFLTALRASWPGEPKRIHRLIQFQRWS